MIRSIETESDKQWLVRLITSRALPFTVNITKGKTSAKTLAQVKLQMLWNREISEEMGDESPEYYRGYNKLHFAVPIRCNEDEQYRILYESTIGLLPYEKQIEAMMKPFDWPATRDMSTKMKGQFLDEVFRHWSEQGVILTIPESER